MWSATLFAICFVQSAFCQPKTVVTGLSYPVHIATDFVGGLFIVDQGCFQITPPGDCNVYKATLNGATYSLTRLSAWTSSTKPLGVAVDNNGNVYTAVFGAGIYQQKPLSPPPTSSYSSPTLVINCPYVSQITVDNHNNLLIVDTGNNNPNSRAIIKEPTGQAFVDCAAAENNSTTIVAVNLNMPQLVTTDAMGDVFTTLYGEQQLVKLAPSGSGYSQTLVTTTAPGNIVGIAMNSRQIGGSQLGYVFVTLGTYHQLVVEIPSGGNYSQNLIYNYPGGLLQGVAVDGTNIFVVDAVANSVLEIQYQPPAPPTGLNGIVK